MPAESKDQVGTRDQAVQSTKYSHVMNLPATNQMDDEKIVVAANGTQNSQKATAISEYPMSVSAENHVHTRKMVAARSATDVTIELIADA